MPIFVKIIVHSLSLFMVKRKESCNPVVLVTQFFFSFPVPCPWQAENIIFHEYLIMKFDIPVIHWEPRERYLGVSNLDNNLCSHKMLLVQNAMIKDALVTLCNFDFNLSSHEMLGPIAPLLPTHTHRWRSQWEIVGV